MDEDAFSAITFFCYNCGSSWFACSSNSSDMFNIICLTCLDNIDNMDKFDKFTSNEDMAIKLVGINEEEGMGVAYVNKLGYLFCDQVNQSTESDEMILYSIRYPLNFGFMAIYLYDMEMDKFTDPTTGAVIENYFRDF
jgi:hypothetical protein